LQAFILQAGARGLFKDTTLVMSAGDHVLPGLGDKVPDGSILGARGAYGILSAKTPLNDWFQARTRRPPACRRCRRATA
jgi:branched-chain amino acid transport system substrate-binding protein